jgi:serine protease Do
VRLTRIDNLDLNLFEFDYDLTMMIFFMNDQAKVYARYGGRDAKNADNRQSLAGLLYTMNSVLAMHDREDKGFAPRVAESAKFARGAMSFGGGRCMHCHQVKEKFDADLKNLGKWNQETTWRFPLPDNLGLILEVDRGNVVKTVLEKSPAAAAGLKPGDVVHKLNGVPIHSFGDAQFALDKAPRTGKVEVAWQRGQGQEKASLDLPEGWRKTDISWRPSLRRLIPAARLSGDNLTLEERKTLGLTPQQLAFRQKDSVSTQAKNAGIQSGDIILGFDDRVLDMDAFAFQYHVQSNYLIGDRVTVNLIRDGKRLNLPMNLVR